MATDERTLADSWSIAGIRVPNRVVLAPLAGIGSWFVRLQAKRYGAGLAFSEMVSSFAIHYRNERTCREMLRIHPDERAGGPVAMQLFGHDPEIMRSAAAHVAEAGADLIDLNMGCPVPKVCKTGAGAALLSDPERAVALARAAVHGARASGRDVPVTAKLRSGLRAGDAAGLELAQRLVGEAGVAAIAFHPRPATAHHKGEPDLELAARLVAALPAPVILTGGLSSAGRVREAFARTGAAAVMLARGALGNPWLFAEVLHGREQRPTPHEVLAELEWTMDRAAEHLGEERAARYMRKFYPWYIPRLDLAPVGARELMATLQVADTLAQAGRLLRSSRAPAAVAA